ncbi:hypothetical protein [Petrocella sp. FN5]|nr:hypothetical protein [Petrocella sp. FN5]MDF1618693.1 hypothetical protein [Petrocella sp. FN5]
MGKIEFRKLLISMNAFIALLAGIIGLPIMTILQNEIPKKLLAYQLLAQA